MKIINEKIGKISPHGIMLIDLRTLPPPPRTLRNRVSFVFFFTQKKKANPSGSEEKKNEGKERKAYGS